MIDLRAALLDSIPKDLDYLVKTYCKETSYIAFPDLKKRHKEYLFNTIRLIRRVLETQLLSINNPGIGVFSLCNQLLQQHMAYYQAIDTYTDVTSLKDACSAFKETTDETTEALQTAINNAGRWSMENDLKPDSVTRNAWTALADRVNIKMPIHGHHVSVLIPYTETDFKYIDGDYPNNKLNVFLEHIFQEPLRHYYGLYTRNLNERLFQSGKCLRTMSDRVNTKSHIFDCAIATRNSLFDAVHPKLSSVLNTLKKDGSVMIIGLTTDFTKLDLKRIASQLTDIRVYFGTTVATPIVQDNEICVLLGRVRREEQVLYPYVNLLDIFVNHISSEDVFELYGSDENTVIPYSSYDITTQDFLELLPAIRQTTDKLVNTLIPKNDDTARRPLLPFSSGQLGLILISGEINGAIREANGCCHVVKGSSKQRTDTKTEETRNEEGVLTHIKETQSVYSSTNVTTIIPSGEIKVLC